MWINCISNNFYLEYFFFVQYKLSCPFVRVANCAASRFLVENDYSIFKDDKCACIYIVYLSCMSRRMSLYSNSILSFNTNSQHIKMIDTETLLDVFKRRKDLY